MIKLSELPNECNIIYYYDRNCKGYGDGQVLTVSDLKSSFKDPAYCDYFVRENVKDRIGIWLAEKDYVKFTDEMFSYMIDQLEEDGDAYDGWSNSMYEYMKKYGKLKQVCDIFNACSKHYPVYKCGEEVEFDYFVGGTDIEVTVNGN